jgi:ClpP class serine protease
VWTGRQALTHGLIDELGGFEEAFAAAKRAAGLAADALVTVERFPKPRRLWKLSVDLNLPAQGVLADLMPMLSSMRFLVRERVWAVLPFALRFF